jgi:hypothetical protein
MTDTTVPYRPGRRLATRPLSVQRTGRRSLTRALTRCLHAWLAGLADEPAVSSLPWIRWP